MRRIQVTIDDDGYEIIKRKGAGVFADGLRIAISKARFLINADIKLKESKNELRRHCVLLDEGEIKFLNKIGDDNVSRGIRKCADALRKLEI